MLDTAEFHNLLIKEVYLLLTMKRILEDIKPNQIFVNEHFGKVLQQKCIDKNIEINLINGIKHEFTISWESFPVELKIDGKTITKRVDQNDIHRGEYCNNFKC